VRLAGRDANVERVVVAGGMGMIHGTERMPVHERAEIVGALGSSRCGTLMSWPRTRLASHLNERMRDPRMPPEMVEAFHTLTR
jgi:hypothetical protein